MIAFLYKTNPTFIAIILNYKGDCNTNEYENNGVKYTRKLFN